MTAAAAGRWLTDRPRRQVLVLGTSLSLLGTAGTWRLLGYLTLSGFILMVLSIFYLRCRAAVPAAAAAAARVELIACMWLDPLRSIQGKSKAAPHKASAGLARARSR